MPHGGVSAPGAAPGQFAAGEADAPAGRTAADAGLDFIPISREIYFMACQKELLQTKAGQDFLTLLGSTDWKEDAEKLLGYDFSDCGKVMEVQAAIPWF